jgi:hypothetical protein
MTLGEANFLRHEFARAIEELDADLAAGRFALRSHDFLAVVVDV